MTQAPENAEAAAEPNPLQWFLRDREYPCPRCGYSLKGLESANCPECGVELQLSVVPQFVTTGAWIAALVGAAGASGLFVFLLFLAFISSARPHGGIAWEILAVVGGALGIELVQLALLVFGKRRFERLPTALRWSLAALIWVVACSLPFVFFVITP